MPPSPTGEALLASILKHDTKTTSYKIALLRALNDVVLLYPEVGGDRGEGVGVPLSRLAELWIAYYWPFVNSLPPTYQGGRGQGRVDMSFRPALTQLRRVWEETLGMPGQEGDGFFLLTEMGTPRRREGYGPVLRQAYMGAVGAIMKALLMPIKYAGMGTWSVFAPPIRGGGEAQALPGTSPSELCLVVSASLWHTFRHLSAYVEALCLHEWALFTEGVTQAREVGRGEVYASLTA